MSLPLERKTSCANICGQTLASRVQPLSSLPHTQHQRVALPLKASKIMQLVSIFYSLFIAHLNLFLSDYPRTLREWGRRLEANLTQDLVAKDYPALSDPSDYAAFKRKWQYLFAYAGAGFSKGYITCHMLTFFREVSIQKYNRSQQGYS